MKNIVNKLRFALLVGLMAMSVTAWSQAVPYINKMSITTQMFLDEMAGRLTFDEETTVPKFQGPGTNAPMLRTERPIASPDTIDGKVYISAIIRVNDINSDVSALEDLGVITQCKFDKGIVTTLIPIDKLNDVAALDGVKRINVASVMRSSTNLARTASNVDDLLTLSNDARNAGLLNVYDGSGIVLAIIDDGVDFQHGAFKDANGNSRIVGAYCYNGSSVTADWSGSGTLPTTDDSSEDHGTHTSTTAGGSSVKVSGTTVTVVSDHSQATYGGMAPGADLYLCGTQLYDTHILNSFQRICDYADAQGKPVVVSNSWGGAFYANDGSSSVADVLEQYFGDDNPNHICLFASGNEAGKSAGSVTGGYYVTGASTQANPLGTIIRTEAYIENYGYSYYSGVLCNAWTRATDATGIALHAYVINKSSGSLVADLGTLQSSNYAAGAYTTLSTSSYFGRNFTVYFDYTEANGKHQALIYTGNYTTSGTNYALAIEVYPIGGSDNNVDIWGGGYTYLAGNVTTTGHTWTAGTDDMSSTGECTNENVISVGSYVTRTRSGSNSVGEISDFSSYALESTGPVGVMLPWITAPGEDIIAGYNHYVSHSSSDLTVNNSSSPYGLMSGTSMATPAAAGIVALWLQAAQEVGKDLTLSEVKNIMAQTAIKDSYVTSGSNASHFGNGKIDALAGVQYILDNYSSSDPTIRPSKTALTYTGEPNGTYTQQITVLGSNLTGNITATLSDPSNVFSMSVTSGSNSLRASGSTTLNAGDVLTIVYSPRAVGTHTGTITLTSDGAEAKTITLNGTAAIKTEYTICNGTDQNGYLPIYGYWYDNKQINQMIYPADSLVDLRGKTFKSMTFYSPHLYFSAGAYTVKVATTNQSTFSSVARLTPSEMTTVKAGVTAVAGGTEITLTFDNEFTYEEGNLLVDIEVTTTGQYGTSQTSFYGVNQSTNTGFYSRGSTTNSNGVYSSANGLQQFLPKLKIIAEAAVVNPSLSVDPTEVNIEDATGDDRSETVAVTAENLTDDLAVTASNNWSAALSQDNTELTVTYNGKALHQTGAATVSSQSDGLSAAVAADYLYTGSIYVIGDVNNTAWNTSSGAQLTRDENGIYTGTITTQVSNDAAYIIFTKRLGTDTNYRFGPVSNGNWWLTTELEDVYAPIDTVGNLNNIRLGAGTWFVTVDSRNNQFKIRPAVTSSSVSPAEGTLSFGQVTVGNTQTMTITITNDGETSYTPTVTTTGNFTTDYTPTELTPGESVTVTVTFTPQAATDYSGNITVTAGNDTYNYTATGTGYTQVMHGYVDEDDQAIDFGEQGIGVTYSDRVRIINDGDLPFTAVLDLSGLEGTPFNVTGNGEVAAGESLDLNVIFRPTEEGSYSGSFVVTINGVPTTVTVTGSASSSVIVDNVVRSNTVTVPVYKTDIYVGAPYTQAEAEADTLMQLTPNISNAEVIINAKRPMAITDYFAYHHETTKSNAVSDENWAVGGIETAVAHVQHDGLAGAYLPMEVDAENQTPRSWVEMPYVTFLSETDNSVDVWAHDNVTVEDTHTYYVPVTVADGKVTKGNTYGAPIGQSLLGEVYAMVNVTYSSERLGGHWTVDGDTTTYCVYTPVFTITGTLPDHVVDINGNIYQRYMYRAWRVCDKARDFVRTTAENGKEGYLADNGPLPNVGLLAHFGGVEDGYIVPEQTMPLGTEWDNVNGRNEKLENAFGAPVWDENGNLYKDHISYVVRFYYKKVEATSGSMLRADVDDPEVPMYYVVEYTPDGNDLHVVTSVVELNVGDREVVDVMYVNPLGMTSDKPFDGVNIIVTRYSDGTTSTTKVLK